MTLSKYISGLPDDTWLYIGTAPAKKYGTGEAGGGGGYLIISKKSDLSKFGWEQYADREIVETYKRRFVEPFGQIVLIKGEEKGDYWTLEEQDFSLKNHVKYNSYWRFH